MCKKKRRGCIYFCLLTVTVELMVLRMSKSQHDCPVFLGSVAHTVFQLKTEVIF